MTFREGAEIVRRKLAGGDISVDFSVENEEVYFIFQQLVPVLINNDYLKLIALEKRVTDATLFTTITSKVYDGDGNEKYVVLPSAPLLLNATIFPKVTYIKDRFYQFNYIDDAQLQTFNDIGVLSELQGTIFTYEHIDECVNEHRLVFFDLDDCVDELRIRLVQSLSNVFNPDSEIPIKPELNYLLLDGAYNWFTAEVSTVKDMVMDGKNDKV